MPKPAREPDWKEWLRRWDVQQAAFNPDRERRFSAMLDIVEASIGRRFRALDLGSGPGSLSARVLDRFPAARVVAVDYDPVAMRVGQGALGSYGGRLRWFDARLGTSGWSQALGRQRFDVALSTTALHWLAAPALRRLYADVGRLVRRGGIYLDGDHVAWGPRHPELTRLAERVRTVRLRGRSRESWWGPWNRWWADAEKVPALRPYFAERARRRAHHPEHGEIPIEVHERALRRAGFREVAVVWQDLENRILFALR